MTISDERLAKISEEAAREADWYQEHGKSDETRLLETILSQLVTVGEHLARVDALLSEFEPVIRAYLDPAATGPLAWAVRKKLSGGKHG